MSCKVVKKDRLGRNMPANAISCNKCRQFFTINRRQHLHNVVCPYCNKKQVSSKGNYRIICA